MAIATSVRPLYSGELACAAGISTDTLRHYERAGILKRPPRTEGGYRLYPPEALDRVHLIRNALSVGFTVSELASIFKVRDTGGAPCRVVASLAADKLLLLDEQIEHLIKLRASLATLVEEWSSRLAVVPDGQRAGLLEAITKQSHRSTTTGGTNESSPANYRLGARNRRLRAKSATVQRP